MTNTIKITLSILLFLCVANMPYGYYQFVRFVAMVGFGILAYQASENKNKTLLIVYLALAVLFQPMFKIALGRELWNLVDVVVGVGLIGSVFVNKQKDKL